MESLEKMKTDKLEYFGKTVVQHGPCNNRVYLIKLDPAADLDDVINRIDRLCIGKGYTKSFAKLRARDYPRFFLAGYRMEAYIPDFYRNGDDCIFACRYFNENRKKFEENENCEIIAKILSEKNIRSYKKNRDSADSLSISRVRADDSKELADFYASQFSSYPFPLNDRDYIIKTIESNVDYFIVRDGNKIIGAASGERDDDELNAEITDFAVSEDYRGVGLAGMLMNSVENHILDNTEIKTLYTICAA